jgi:hypothetical protein
MFGFKLNSALRASSAANGDDVLNMKQGLNKLGHYEAPAYGMTPYPDTPMFDGMKAFQKKNGLTVDGYARPGGPTEKTLNSHLANTAHDLVQRKDLNQYEYPDKSKRPGKVSTLFAYDPELTDPFYTPKPKVRRAIQKVDWNGRPLRLGGGVGQGQVNRGQDVVGLKNALAWTGHYPVEKAYLGNPTTDEDLTWGLMGFQRDFGLKTDGFSRPGGETESRLNDLISPLIKRASATISEPRSAAPSQGVPQANMARAASSDKSNAPPPVQLAQAQGTPSGNAGAATPSASAQQIGPAAKPNLPKSLAGMDLSFLHAQEGFETQGYVPEKKGVPIENSGVTIGAGVDLGQMNEYDLNKLTQNHGLDPALAQKLKPYLGLQRGQAQTYLANNPISLTQTEAEQLTDAKYSQIAGDLIQRYDAEMAKQGSTSTFASLPDKMKTVALSVALQHGHLYATTPNFWGHLLSGNAKAIEGELRNFQDNYPSRRNREADYLRKTTP